MDNRSNRPHLLAHTVLTLVALTGIVGPFLPFTYDISPASLILEIWLEYWPNSESVSILDNDYLAFLALALPFFLSPFIVAGALRWLISGSLPRIERTILYVASGVSAALTLYACLRITFDNASWQDHLASLMALTTLLLGAFLFIRNARMLPARNFNPVLAAQVAYLANAVLCLILFGDWQIGAYCALAAACAHMLQILLISWPRSNISVN